MTFDNDYFTAQGWAANNKIYNPTSTSTPTLADGFSAIIAGKNDTYAPIMILGSGAGTGKDALCLMLSNIMGGDSWFTYSATELEVDAEYKLTTTIGSNNGTLLPSVGLLAWETGTVPQEKYIQTNALIDELNKNIAIENEITETFTATSTSMTFGIGFGPSVNSTDARYIYNMRVLIGNMKIEKVEDDDVTTDIESTEATTISLYPNPATNKLNVAGLAEGESVEIYNATGALVISTMNTSIDVSNLAQGIYFVKLGNVVKQFVKQ